MSRRAQILSVAACALACAPGAARAETRPLYGGDVVASLLGEPASIDPVLARSEAEVALSALLFDTLYRVDASGRAVPHLAATLPEPEEGGDAYRIELRPGAAFHDGAEVTAEDVARSLERTRASAASWLLAPVEAAWADGDAIVVEASPSPLDLSQLLAAPATAVTPGGRPPDAGDPVGSGPFELASLSRGRRRARLRAFEQHFAGRPYVDRIDFRWYARAGEEARRYEAGETHVSLRGAAAFAGSEPKYETRAAEGAAAVLTYVGFGGRVAGLREVEAFRTSLSLAIGRRGFRAIGSGERVIPAVTPAPPDLGGPAVEAVRGWGRPAEAEATLRRAALRSPELRALLAEDAPSIEVLVDASRPEDRLVAEKVVAALYGLGFRAHIAEAPARQMARRARRGECALYIGQLAAPLPSARVQVAAALAAGRRDGAAARLLRGDTDVDSALERFDASLPILPLFHRALRVHHRGDLYGLEHGATGRVEYADLFFFGAPDGGAR